MEIRQQKKRIRQRIHLKAIGLSDKPIVFVAPSGAGGGWDLTARAITKVLSETNLVKQTMTVENKPGGGGAVFMAEYATQDTKMIISYL